MASDQRLGYSDLPEVVPGSRPDPTIQGYGIEVYDYSGDLEPLGNHPDPTKHEGKILSPSGTTEAEGKILTPSDDSGKPQDRSLPPLPPLPVERKILGLRRRTFWIIAGVVGFVIVAAAIGGGVGGYFASKNNKKSSAVASQYQNLSISSLHWVDGANVSQFRVYYQPPKSDEIFESAWNSTTKSWGVSTITDQGANMRNNSPLAASAGYPHTNTTNELVKNVYYLEDTDKVIERQSPYKDQVGAWGDDNFSELYTASNNSGLTSYWYQNFDSRVQILTMFYQELGANSLSVARYIENKTDSRPWVNSQQSIAVQDGTSVAVAPAGSRRDLRLYVGGTDGTMKQYPYDIQTNELGEVANTAYTLAPRTPICVTTEDNRNYFTDATLPECAQKNTGAFITHLILFASTDRTNLTLVSWNCSSGFTDASSRIEKLMKPGRTYLDISTTSASNLTFDDDRVYVLYDEGKGPAVEEWKVPASGGEDKSGQNGEWTLGDSIPISE